jgi:hypothetical protein
VAAAEQASGSARDEPSSSAWTGSRGGEGVSTASVVIHWSWSVGPWHAAVAAVGLFVDAVVVRGLWREWRRG